MDFVTGEDRNQIILLPDCVDDYVNDNNTVRVIDAYVNNLDLVGFGFTKSVPNATGRPMYGAKDLLKLYIYGYSNRIRSSRRLETETKRNLEVIWLLRKLSPDHKTISDFRSDNAKVLKDVFRDFVKLCMDLGLYGRELVSIDGSKFKAVNAKDRNFNEKKLKERLKHIEEQIEEYMRQMEETDRKEEAVDGEKTAEEIQAIIAGLVERKAEYEGYTEELESSGETQKSLTDPDSRRMIGNGKPDIGYNVQTAVDSKNGMIAEFNASNSPNDKNQLTEMALMAAEILEKEKLTAVADKGYDSASDIAKSILNGIVPHVAGADYNICLPTDEGQGERITSHSDGRTIYLPERNVALCPMGKALYPGSYKNKDRKALFYNAKACAACTCKCTEGKHKIFEIAMRKTDFKKEYDDKGLYAKQARVIADKDIVRQRKCLSEHPFGTVKRGMDADYFLTKGLSKITGELSLMFLAYNMKRAINILGSKKLIDSFG